MPNIIITEGLDTPWELANTESNITATTDLESINLANQTVGTLAYTASQLFGSLKTEKNNLDNIVDAIELINEEIALFPERISKWDTARSLNIPDSAVDVVTLPLISRILAEAIPGLNALTEAPPVNFIGDSNSGLAEERNYISTLSLLIQAKPLLDNAVDLQNNQIGYVYLQPTVSAGANAFWTLTNSVVEGSIPGTGGNFGDLVVYRNSSGQPVSYEIPYQYYDQDTQELSERRLTLQPSEVSSFAVPRDKAELARWRDAVRGIDFILATNALKNSTGLPEGVTPPTTTLGVNVEKYYDTAKYSLGGYSISGPTSIPTPSDNYPIIMHGAYPPIQRADFDKTKITVGDVGKFFQKPGTDTVYYISEKRSDGTFLIREGGATEKFISNMTDEIEKALRGEYAEKQILLTQRGTDQTLFVTSITQRYTTFSDMATNLLKTLVNFYNDLARNLRG
jgi:hypothetical protein